MGTNCSWAIPSICPIALPLSHHPHLNDAIVFSPQTQCLQMDPLPLYRFFVEHGSEPLTAFVRWALHCWCPGRRGRERLVLPSPGTRVLSLPSASPWDPLAHGINRVRYNPHHMHTFPTPCLDSTAPLPRPYLPTAKTVSPMVMFCSMASCLALSGSKVPSQRMGAPQEVQVRTSGRALSRAGMGR